MSSEATQREQTVIKWLLFITMTLTVPVFYYFFVVGGILSYASVVTMSLPGVKHPFHLLSIVHWLHLCIYGAVFFLISGATAKDLCRHGTRQRRLRVVGTLILFFSISLLPIFGFFGHWDFKSQNAYQAWSVAWNGTRELLER